MFDLRSGTFNATAQWLGRVGAALAQLQAGTRDFRYLNVGDSIATGMLGITSTTDHYAARAAQLTASSHGRRARRGLVAEGATYDGGRIAVTGAGWRRDLTNGGYFGTGAYELLPGGDALLTFTPGVPATSFSVSFDADAGIEYSVDGGVTWVRQDEPRADFARLDIPVALASSALAIRALDRGAPARIYSLDFAAAHEPSLTWFTSGIGGARTTDLLAGLEANDERGFRAYGSAHPDLLTIEIGVNDTIHADEVAKQESADALRAIVRGLATHGVRNIALVGACPVRADYQPGPWRVADAYERIYRPVSLEFGIPLLEWCGRWGDWAQADQLGFYADQVHPNRDGHWDAGAMVAGLLARARG
ncbi:MAG TPA: SGNH/GDSL hydrolase family protein [Leifsonia sp.]|nr:SGNH/GDSL hydrolase family protein [Leifsonia sp.]